jgi:hypothetical protein
MAFKDLQRDILELFAEECPATHLWKPPRPGGKGGVKLPLGMSLTRGPREPTTKPKVRTPPLSKAAYAAAYRRAHREERRAAKRRRRGLLQVIREKIAVLCGYVARRSA